MASNKDPVPEVGLHPQVSEGVVVEGGEGGLDAEGVHQSSVIPWYLFHNDNLL